jgi:integrase/recombinase XerD
MNELQALFEQYINECRYSACLRPETLRGYKNVFSLFLKVMPEVRTLKSLTCEVFNEFFKRIQTRQRPSGTHAIKIGVKKSTIKTQWCKLNAFTGWLYKNGHIAENPLTAIRPPQPEYDDYRRLSDSDIHRIYSAISRSSSDALTLRRDNLMVSLLLYCGLRKGEFISLHVRDVDLHKNEITVRAETSKSKKLRVLPMHDTLVFHMNEYLKERNTRKYKTEFLIVSTKNDQELTREGLKHWVKSLIKKSGIKFHLHRFRHTFACKLAEANVSAFNIQMLMGHSSVMMTMKYVRSLRPENMGMEIGKISFG